MIVGQIHPAGLDLLAGRHDLVFTQIGQDPETVAAHMIAADAVIVRAAKLDANVIASANRLRLVARFGVGYDNVDLGALTARKIPLAIVGDANAQTVAEHTMLMILMLAKRALQWHDATRDGLWRGEGLPFGADLRDKTVLIIGLGRTGTRVARLCRAFGMTVLVYDPYVDNARIAASGATRADTLIAGLAAADFTTLHAPLNPETRLMIGDAQLSAMPAHAYLVNVARGGLVDEVALAKTLKNKTIAGAALDVFAHEPLPSTDPLIGTGGLVLSPHVAGISVECLERMSVQCARNVLDYIDGKLDPALVVNPEVLAGT